MKTIKYLLIILFCSCATLLYSQVESTYYFCNSESGPGMETEDL